MGSEEGSSQPAGGLKVGARVLIYGEPGEIQKAQPLGDDRHRYTISFQRGSRVQTYTSPPTTIELLRGPTERLAHGELSSKLEFDLLNEALRLSTVYESERLVSLSSSRINMEPYQVFAVHQVISSFPHRYLLADDAGLGKTIETGMILEELTARGRADRVLVVTPAALAHQWKEELRRAFGRDYVFYDGDYIRQLMEQLPPEQNPWDREARIITKLDLAKRDEIRVQLERTRWDVVIFDEAHKLGARRYRAKVEETQRYRLAKTLADRTDSLLLLSATPHNGDRYSFYALLTLLDEYTFPDPESVSPTQVARVAIRRTKRDILDEHGKPVFVSREVQTLPVVFSPAEEALYRAVKPVAQTLFRTLSALKNARPDRTDTAAKPVCATASFGHPLFDSIVEHCKNLEPKGIATVKQAPSVEWAGVRGLLFSYLLKFTDGMDETVGKKFHQIFLDSTGRSRPEVIPAIPQLPHSSPEAPQIPVTLRELAQQASFLTEAALTLAREAADVLEEEVQAERSRLVQVMREDLDKYATAKDARLKARLSDARRRLREAREQLAILDEEGKRRRAEATLRLREYDVQQTERELGDLAAKVQRRSEELGNMEIVVDEEPRLVSLAVVEFVPPKEG